MLSAQAISLSDPVNGGRQRLAVAPRAAGGPLLIQVYNHGDQAVIYSREGD